MNKLRFFLLALTALLLVTSFSFAGEDHDGERHHKVKIKIAGDGNGVESFDFGDIEVGETRQFFTDSGKEVTITRDEDNYTVNVDGKDIDIHTSGHHGASVIDIDGEEGHKVKVITKTMHISGDGEEGENVFVFKTGGEHGEHVFHSEHGDEHGEHSFVWISDDEGSKSHDFVIKKSNVLSHVLESDALDGLDEETRERIIKAIKEGEKTSMPHAAHGAKMIVIDAEIDEEN